MKAKKTNQLTVTWGLTKYALKASLRNKASYFFTLLFPIIFISIFGAFSNGSSATKIGVTDTVSRDNAIYKALDGFAHQENAPIELVTGNQEDLEKQLSKDDIASVVEPAGDSLTTVTLVTSNSSPQGKATSESIINGIISQMNLQAAQQASHLATLPFGIKSKEISGKSFNYIDFLLPGQVGFSLLSLATFGIGFSLITLRKTLVLKRMFATTVHPISFIIAQCLSRGVQAVVQTAVLIGFGALAFDFTLANGWITFVELVALSFIGVLAFLGFGIFMSNIAKDEQSLPVALNIINLPQMLLAGVFFPTDAFPHWLQLIGNNLPLAYLNTAMRNISIEGASFTAQWPYLLGLLAWAVVAYGLTAKTFKSE